MGLDAVEIVIRVEEFFVISIGDDEAAAVRTVGDFYNLICAKLNVQPLQSPLSSPILPIVADKEKTLLFLYKSTPRSAPSEVLPWSPQTVWDSLVAVVADQQCLDSKKILHHSRFVEDLGVA
jgi:hypothetical protein